MAPGEIPAPFLFSTSSLLDELTVRRWGERIAVLHTHFHQQLYANSGKSIFQRFEANHFAEVFAVGRGRIFRIRHGDEKAHANFVAGFAGLERDAAARNAGGPAQILEMFFLRIGGANAHQLINLAAAAAAAFGLRSFPEVLGHFQLSWS